ncbi:hypothetical protein BD414DRAFT_499894 [Trametes punicea]|nr:hypothetical protein BD414DRAFT_499894 [Trametes punicea]
MGVPGLWDILRPAGQVRSLTHLSVKDGFEANPDGKRGLRRGENPELRTLFFRCTRLMSAPFLPLFVFDGPKRPDLKRGKRVTGKNHWLVQGMQEIITAFGFEWRMAPGEAEAELAYLNRIGVIDAVLSDDVDTFLFGAKVVLRNKNITLSGNAAHSLKNAAGKDDGNHAMVYRSEDILNHEKIQLTQGGLILIGILCGGDYDQAGLAGCGGALAHGLARCGFGDSLLAAARSKSREELEDFLAVWRDEIRHELRTNSRGLLPRKSPKLSQSIPNDFPNIDVVLAYTAPITSEAKGLGYKNTVVDWDKEPDLGKIAGLCEMYFEWGIKDIIIKRFRTVLWPSAVLRILRRAAITKDRKAASLASSSSSTANGVPATPRKNGKERRAPPGTPSSMIAKHFSTMRLDSPRGGRAGTLSEEDEDGDEGDERLIIKIHSSRRHPSTDHILEYRLEIAPAQLVRLCEAGIRGLRTALPPELSDEDEYEEDSDDEEGGGGKKGKKKTARAKKPPPDPASHLRIWLPACMVEMVEPQLVEEYEGLERKKAEKKAAKAAGKGTRADTTAGAKKGKKAVAVVEEEEESSPASSYDDNHRSRKPRAAVVAKRANKPAVINGRGGSADPSKTMDDFFAARKPSANVSVKLNKATTSNAARVAELFKETQSTTRTLQLSDSSDADGRPRSSHRSPLPIMATSQPTANITAAPSQLASGRILSFLDNYSDARATGSSKPSPSASTSSPSKSRTLQPFPMDFDTLPYSHPQPSVPDKPSRSRRRSPLRMRPRSSVSSDSDCRGSALQESPRRSDKHLSPRPTTSEQIVAGIRREEEEWSESEDERPPSPSPLRGRQWTALSGRSVLPMVATRKEEEEESERAPSPSPIRSWTLPSGGPVRLPVGTRKPPLPANLTIISISSDSEDEISAPCMVAPLQQARARLAKLDGPFSKDAKQPPSSSTRASQNVPRRTYDPEDIIDLT